jgi:hypothetical protein
MPITYVIDRLRQRMLTQASGLVTFADVIGHLDQEERDRGLDLPELVDARGAQTDLTAEQVRRLVQRAVQLLRTIPLGPTAIVASDDTLFGMARMYSILVEQDGISVDVFRDIESAQNWLDSPADRTSTV